MRKYDIDLYKKKLQKKLDSDRYEHTIGVAYTAASLAMRYKYDVNKALIAGLLHDNAKCISYEKKIQLCEKYNIHLSEVEKENPALLHAKLGAFLAMHKFNITDKDIISSILYHTTGPFSSAQRRSTSTVFFKSRIGIICIESAPFLWLYYNLYLAMFQDVYH